MLGLRSCIFRSRDIKKLAAWYETVLEKKAYFENESYIGFDVSGYELGIYAAEKPDMQAGENVEIYWGVADVEKEFERLISLGAKLREKPVDVGGGIIMANVYDPDGNIFGIIYNPHFSV